MALNPRKLKADPIKWIYAIHGKTRLKVGCVYKWNTGEEQSHFDIAPPAKSQLVFEDLDDTQEQIT